MLRCISISLVVVALIFDSANSSVIDRQRPPENVAHAGRSSISNRDAGHVADKSGGLNHQADVPSFRHHLRPGQSSGRYQKPRMKKPEYRKGYTPYSPVRDNPLTNGRHGLPSLGSRYGHQLNPGPPLPPLTPSPGPQGYPQPQTPPHWPAPKYQYVRFKTLYDTTKDRRRSASCYDLTPLRAAFYNIVDGSGCTEPGDYYTFQGGWCWSRSDTFICAVTNNKFETREECFDACMPRCEVFQQDAEDCKMRGYQRKIGYTVDESRFKCTQIRYYHGCPGRGNLFQNYFDCKRECQEEYEL